MCYENKKENQNKENIQGTNDKCLLTIIVQYI